MIGTKKMNPTITLTDEQTLAAQRNQGEFTEEMMFDQQAMIAAIRLKFINLMNEVHLLISQNPVAIHTPKIIDMADKVPLGSYGNLHFNLKVSFKK